MPKRRKTVTVSLPWGWLAIFLIWWFGPCHHRGSKPKVDPSKPAVAEAAKPVDRSSAGLVDALQADPLRVTAAAVADAATAYCAGAAVQRLSGGPGDVLAAVFGEVYVVASGNQDHVPDTAPTNAGWSPDSSWQTRRLSS